MEKGILTFDWVCENLENGFYKTKKWVCRTSEIVTGFKSPYVDLDEGWYVDLDKRKCYYYSKYFETNAEVVDHLKTIINNPIAFPVDSLVRYEYALLEFKTENCGTSDYTTTREKMSCLCKEGTTENCKDEKTGIQIKKLNTCIPVGPKTSVYIKTTSEAMPV